MYEFLLIIHSWVRWIVLVLGVIIIIQGYTGWKGDLPFTKGHNTRSAIFVGSFHLQLLLGLLLYFVFSPIIDIAFQDFGAAMKNSELRFWAVEHILMMVLAAVLAQIGRIKIKRADTDGQKHKQAFLWFLAALVLVLSRIPWSEAGRLLRGL